MRRGRGAVAALLVTASWGLVACSHENDAQDADPCSGPFTIPPEAVDHGSEDFAASVAVTCDAEEPRRCSTGAALPDGGVPVTCAPAD